MVVLSYFKKFFTNAKAYAVAFFYWLFLGAVTGALCGLCGALFAKSISFVTGLRADNGWILLLLPFGGLVSVAVYKLCRVTDVGTNQIFECARSEKQVPFLLMPAIFVGSVITHLCGGSAGKEGAALQLGGSISVLLSKILHLEEKKRHILTMCGMGALFSAVFGTPLGACVFALEVVRVGNFCSAAFFPSFVSSVTAYLVSTYLGTAPERFSLPSVPEVNPDILWRVMVIAVAGAIVSIIFCRLLHLGENIFRKFFKNPFIRIFIGGVLIILLTYLLGTNDYNGSGTFVIHRIFTDGNVRVEAFLLKTIFTVITVSAGFKGGEIVPTLFIGATLGGVLAILLGFTPAFGAAVGMAALFCGVTNCPLATIFLCTEMFGATGILFFALSSITSFLLSGWAGLYSGQRFVFSKLNDEILNREVG